MRQVRATYKARDSWWTVLLVDPYVGPLVRVAAPHQWITPNLLTAIAFLLGMGAAASFFQATPGWLVAGAVLYHLGFVIDCMDGKIARLQGSGSIFGAWLDFILDRMRVVICTAALFAGQFYATGNHVFLFAATGVVFLSLIGYVNGAETDKAMARMAGGAPAPARARALPDVEVLGRLRDLLHRRRIRMNLVSGIEFELAVFIIAPVAAAVTAPGAILVVTAVAAALLLTFELALIARFWLATRSFSRQPHGGIN